MAQVEGEGVDQHSNQGEEIHHKGGLLVSLGLIQPDPTYEGAHHASNDNSQTNPSSIDLFTLIRTKSRYVLVNCFGDGLGC